MTPIHQSLMVIALVLTVICAQAQQPPTGQRMRVPPQDESERAPGFRPFIARFELAVRERDVAAVLSMVSETIVSDPFGDGLVGRAAFRKYHKLDDRNGEVWSVLNDLLGKGAAVDGCGVPEEQCRVSFPYWNERIRLDHLDHVITRENTLMYAAPTSGAMIVERLSYEVVQRVTDYANSPPDGWLTVSLLDSRKGFIREDGYYSLIGMRMTFYRRDNGTWMLGDFLGGD